MADVRRDRDAGDGEADGLALGAAGAANGISHEQELRDIASAKAGAAKGLSDTELALQGDAAGHLFEFRFTDGIGGPERAGERLWGLVGHDGSF